MYMYIIYYIYINNNFCTTEDSERYEASRPGPIGHALLSIGDIEASGTVAEWDGGTRATEVDRLRKTMICLI